MHTVVTKHVSLSIQLSPGFHARHHVNVMTSRTGSQLINVFYLLFLKPENPTQISTSTAFPFTWTLQHHHRCGN